MNQNGNNQIDTFIINTKTTGSFLYHYINITGGRIYAATGVYGLIYIKLIIKTCVEEVMNNNNNNNTFILLLRVQ